MDGYRDGQMDGWTEGRIQGWMDGWMENVNFMGVVAASLWTVNFSMLRIMFPVGTTPTAQRYFTILESQIRFYSMQLTNAHS